MGSLCMLPSAMLCAQAVIGLLWQAQLVDKDKEKRAHLE